MVCEMCESEVACAMLRDGTCVCEDCDWSIRCTWEAAVEEACELVAMAGGDA